MLDADLASNNCTEVKIVQMFPPQKSTTLINFLIKRAKCQWIKTLNSQTYTRFAFCYSKMFHRENTPLWFMSLNLKQIYPQFLNSTGGK